MHLWFRVGKSDPCIFFGKDEIGGKAWHKMLVKSTEEKKQ
jgi:hypothetical protein